MKDSRCRAGMYIVSAEPPMRRSRCPVSAARRSRWASDTLLKAGIHTGRPTKGDLSKNYIIKYKNKCSGKRDESVFVLLTPTCRPPKKKEKKKVAWR